MAFTFGNRTHITGGNFYSISGNLNQVFSLSNDGMLGSETSSDHSSPRPLELAAQVLDILRPNIVVAALHDSAAGGQTVDPPCHPGTRISLLRNLSSWSLANEQPILWLHGSAGIGKSAVARYFVDNAQQNGMVVASFFFRRAIPATTSSSGAGFVATLAYQLAAGIPGFCRALHRVIATDRLIVGRSLSVQFQRLLIDPFVGLPIAELRPIIVLDGLDECLDRKHQQHVLTLFCDAMRNGKLPIRLFLSSRPEPHLHLVLSDGYPSLCQPMELAADPSAYEDVHIYLRDEFLRVRKEAGYRGILLTSEWPSAKALNHLVRKSSATFIYATTVVRFVEDDFSRPDDRLDLVLALDPASMTPLDDLYVQILGTIPLDGTRRSDLLRVLHVLSQREGDLDPEEIDLVLDFRPGTTRLLLRGLHSVLRVPPIGYPLGWRDCVNVLHASFMDFLCDERRSGPWCTTAGWLKYDLLIRALRFMAKPDLTYRVLRGVAVVPLVGRLLQGVEPDDGIIRLLRDPHVENSLSLISKIVNFDDTVQNTRYPADITVMFKTLTCISCLISVEKSETRPPSTSSDVQSYIELFAANAPLLFFTQVLALHNRDVLWAALEMCAETHSVFKPLLRCTSHLASNGELFLPTDFVCDPEQSGTMFADSSEVNVRLMLTWIAFVRRHCAFELRLESGRLSQSTARIGLDIILSCPTSEVILTELQTLDLAISCREVKDLADDHALQAAHQGFHELTLLPSAVQNILTWLGRFPVVPAASVTYWEKQYSDIRVCCSVD